MGCPPPIVGSRALIAALLLATTVLTHGASPSRAGEPIALHPQNPHYFLWRGQPTLLVTSGEHYGALLNLDFDYRVYFETLQRDGLNHTRTFSGAYRELPSSFGITDNTLAPPPGRFACPWARSDAPGCSDGGNKFDLTRWNADYFRRLKDYFAQAARCGVVVEFNLFCPMYNDELWLACPMNAANNVNGLGQCPKDEVYTLKHPQLLDIQLALTRKLVAETAEFDNVYYEVCNEPYFGGVTREWQYRIVDAIVQAESARPRRHLISLNIANGSQKVEDPHPHVSILNFHYCVPPQAVAENYALQRVIGENETGFRGRDDVLYRTEGWEFLLAGGGLYNNLDYSFTARHPDGRFLEYRSPGGGSPDLRRQLGILKRFLEGLDFVRMAPDGVVIQSVSEGLAARALSEPGQTYAIYVQTPLPNKPKPEQAEEIKKREQRAKLALKLSPGGYRVEWVDTKTGEVIETQTVAAKETIELASPPFRVDIALRLLREEEDAVRRQLRD